MLGDNVKISPPRVVIVCVLGGAGEGICCRVTVSCARVEAERGRNFLCRFIAWARAHAYWVIFHETGGTVGAVRDLPTHIVVSRIGAKRLLGV